MVFFIGLYSVEREYLGKILGNVCQDLPVMPLLSVDHDFGQIVADLCHIDWSVGLNLTSDPDLPAQFNAE